MVTGFLCVCIRCMWYFRHSLLKIHNAYELFGENAGCPDRLSFQASQTAFWDKLLAFDIATKLAARVSAWHWLHLFLCPSTAEICWIICISSSGHGWGFFCPVFQRPSAELQSRMNNILVYFFSYVDLCCRSRKKWSVVLIPLFTKSSGNIFKQLMWQWHSWLEKVAVHIP